jgi:Flp pilus assembly protein CpaB
VSSRRTLILLGAIAVGVVAALLLFNYVRGIEDRANRNVERVDVFAAKSQVPRGTPGETAVADGSVGAAKIPQEFRPATAITSTDEIQKKVALFDIAPGTVIVQGMFVDPAQTQISFRARLKNPDHVAVSVSVDQVRGVGGFLVPGDDVNIMVFQQGGQGAETGGGEAPEGGDQRVTAVLNSFARMLYQEVHVLAVGATPQLAPGEQAQTTAEQPQDTGLLTFNVPPEAALWIASAQQGGGMYLTLVPEDYTPRLVQPIDPLITTLPGEDPAQLTPYGPEGYTE